MPSEARLAWQDLGLNRAIDPRSNPLPKGYRVHATQQDSKIVFGLSQVVFEISKAAFGISKVVSGISEVVSDISEAVFGISKVVFGISEVAFGISKVVSDTFKAVFEMSNVTLDTSAVVFEVSDVVWEDSFVILSALSITFAWRTRSAQSLVFEASKSPVRRRYAQKMRVIHTCVQQRRKIDTVKRKPIIFLSGLFAIVKFAQSHDRVFAAVEPTQRSL